MNRVINVFLMDFKTAKVREMVVENEDDSCTILINSQFSDETRRKAYLHAMKHILGNDFEKADVQAIERHAHSSGRL